MDEILTAYAHSSAGLVVPRHAGQRGNPVLIDRRYFAELLALPPEVGPARPAASATPTISPGWMSTTNAVLHDLDRPEDYARWRPPTA